MLLRDPKAAAAGAVAGEEMVRLAFVLAGVDSNKTKSCCCGGWKGCGCSDVAGRLGELEGGHGDCCESVVKTVKSGMAVVLRELARELGIASLKFRSTWEGRAEGGGGEGRMVGFCEDGILTGAAGSTEKVVEGSAFNAS